MMHGTRRQFAPAPDRSKRVLFGVLGVVLILVLVVPVARGGVVRVARGVGVGITRVGATIRHGFTTIGTAFTTKQHLARERDDLQAQVALLSLKGQDYDAVLRENTALKESLGRTDVHTRVLAAVLATPPRSLYDTLLLDGGQAAGMHIGARVFAYGLVPLGQISEVIGTTATARLYSAPGNTVEAMLAVEDANGKASLLSVVLKGTGGGNYTLEVPHDVVVRPGALARTKEIMPHTIAVFQKVVSDARDPFQTLLLSSPINMQELQFVEVEK
jgi:cell shape-determining protein MreC